MRADKVVALLSLGLPPALPPPALKQRLLAALSAPKLELRKRRGAVQFQEGVLSTGVGASAEVRVQGQLLVSFTEKAQATFRLGAEGYELLLEKGGALVQVVKGHAFRTVMPLGLVTVKGTWFYAEARGKKQSYLCLCEGWVGLRAPGLSTELKTKDHWAVTLHLKDGKTQTRPASTDHFHPSTGSVHRS